MNTADVEQNLSGVQTGKRLETAVGLDLILISARLLFTNGQTTRTMVAAVQKLGARLGVRASVFPRWGELTVRIEDAVGSSYEIMAVEPAGVDMNKVIATMGSVLI